MMKRKKIRITSYLDAVSAETRSRWISTCPRPGLVNWAALEINELGRFTSAQVRVPDRVGADIEGQKAMIDWIKTVYRRFTFESCNSEDEVLGQKWVTVTQAVR